MSLTFVSNSNRYEIRFHKDTNTEQLGKSFNSIKQALSYVKRIYITDAEICEDFNGGLMEIYDNLSDVSVECWDID